MEVLTQQSDYQIDRKYWKKLKQASRVYGQNNLAPAVEVLKATGK